MGESLDTFRENLFIKRGKLIPWLAIFANHDLILGRKSSPVDAMTEFCFVIIIIIILSDIWIISLVSPLWLTSKQGPDLI